LANGLKMLNDAIKLDQKFALPYLGVAYYYRVATDFYMVPAKALPQLKIAAQTVIEMDVRLLMRMHILVCIIIGMYGISQRQKKNLKKH
jgi:hypothetical protein